MLDVRGEGMASRRHLGTPVDLLCSRLVCYCCFSHIIYIYIYVCCVLVFVLFVYDKVKVNHKRGNETKVVVV